MIHVAFYMRLSHEDKEFMERQYREKNKMKQIKLLHLISVNNFITTYTHADLIHLIEVFI